jgi:hypothetical protein
VVRRARRSPVLDDEPATAPESPPRVSVIVPARDEARNIAACVQSVLATTWPDVEVIVVDDHSTDGTGARARAAAPDDARLRVLSNPELPPGWFGKQWACATGARAATGAVLLFADADTRHAPDLIARTMHFMQRERADLLSVVGRQVLGSFWERLLQPQVFAMLAARYGGAASVNAARRAEDVIANGQCLLVTRAAYDALGGHEAVRDKVAEDLALAQRAFRAGMRVRAVAGIRQLSTRMYESLGELVRGWRKNVFAGGRDAVPFGALGRAVFPFALAAGPLLTLAPALVLVLSLAGVLGTAWLIWGAVTTAASLAWWGVVYRFAEEPTWYALLFPLGAATMLYIVLGAIARGSRVAWKGRRYVSS